MFVKIKTAIGKSFGIRCPNSVQAESSADIVKTFDFESECQWSEMPLDETAFCGKCARKNSIGLLYNLNTSLTYNYVS